MTNPLANCACQGGFGAPYNVTPTMVLQRPNPPPPVAVRQETLMDSLQPSAIAGEPPAGDTSNKPNPQAAWPTLDGQQQQQQQQGLAIINNVLHENVMSEASADTTPVPSPLGAPENISYTQAPFQQGSSSSNNQVSLHHPHQQMVQHMIIASQPMDQRALNYTQPTVQTNILPDHSNLGPQNAAMAAAAAVAQQTAATHLAEMRPTDRDQLALTQHQAQNIVPPSQNPMAVHQAVLQQRTAGTSSSETTQQPMASAPMEQHQQMMAISIVQPVPNPSVQQSQTLTCNENNRPENIMSLGQPSCTLPAFSVNQQLPNNSYPASSNSSSGQHQLINNRVNTGTEQSHTRKKARRHTMSSPFPAHLDVQSTNFMFNPRIPQSTAAVGHNQYLGQHPYVTNASAVSTPPPPPAVVVAATGSSCMTPSMFSDDQKVAIMNGLAKERQRPALGPITLPPPPTPAELGLQPVDQNDCKREYEQMSREQLIARLVELEQEKRANESQQTSPNSAGTTSKEVAQQNQDVSRKETLPDNKEEKDIQQNTTEQPSCRRQQSDIKETSLEETGAQSKSEPKNEQLQCLWKDCGQRFDTLEKLTSHIGYTHVGSGKPTYRCQWEGCARNQKPFTKRHKMYNHLRTHTGERPFACDQPGCGKRFSRPDSLTTHIKTHSNVRPYICSTKGCGKAYYHARSLKKHEKTHESSSSSMGEHISFASTTTAPYNVTGQVPVQMRLQHPLTTIQPHPPPAHTDMHPHTSQHPPPPFVTHQFHVSLPATTTQPLATAQPQVSASYTPPAPVSSGYPPPSQNTGFQ